MFVVKCPRCGKNQKTSPKISVVSDVSKKVKRCVYCGFSFKISPAGNSRIVGRG